MDRNTIGNEIEAEINASYRYKNLRELIDILLSVIILKTGKKELVGIEERLYVSLGKIFDGETTINDIKLCLSNVIKIEPLLKKMILLIDEDEYDKIVQENLGLAHVITQLGLNPDNKKLDRKPEDYLGDGNYMEHIARSYALRNSESHTYVGWTRREIYTNLDSVLITCLRAVEINKKALLSNLKKKSINNELNIENYLNEITQQLKKRMSRFIHIRGEENFSVLGSYVIEYQDDTSDSRRRKGTVEYLRDNSIPERRMMIWGEAGMGKTTTLEYLTYMDAKKRLKDSNYNIPVLVLLGVMTKATYTIKQYIFSLNTEEERLKGKKFYPTIQEAVAGSAIGNEQGEEYQKGIDHVIATFENSNYVIMLCQSCKGNSEVCRAWVKLKKEKIDGKDRYAFLETHPVTMFRKNRSTKYSEYDMVGYDLWTGDYYMQDLSAYSKEKRFASGDVMKYGLRGDESINKLSVEGQKPDGIVEYKNFGEVWYFWYYTDLKSKKKGTELNYTLGGKDNE